MSDGYEILTLDEVETASHRGSTLIPVRHRLGFKATGVNAWKADAGGQLIPPHKEDSGNEELYAVVRGRARFTIGEEDAEAPAGTLVFLPPEVFRTAVAAEDDTIVFAVGGTVGKAFDSGGWDSFALAHTEKPGHWGVHYNAGCLESLADNADAALEHLRRAKELDTDGESAQYFREDSDLDPLRDDPRFQELLA